MSNTSKVFNNDGDTLTVASGGSIVLESGATLTLPGGDAEGTKTFTGDVTISGSNLAFSGTTGQNNITMTDNLASALTIEEGSNVYLKFVTTNSGEGITASKDLTMASGTDITFTGTTGQPQINLTDNLADALSICESTNDYITFTTTNSSEAVNLGQNLVIADAKNITVNATTGTKIGTATTQKLGFFNATPVVQPAGTADVTGFVAGSGTASKSDSVWAGASGSAAYTVGDIVTALKALGLLAA
ncbi:MAG: hypothetical protein K8U57_30395 [Planctomycetes bacterium]|nr:hypothetical protein [Planctomycetota bacterium]